MFEGINPGETINCEIIKRPDRPSDRHTLARLMRQDVEIRRKLKKAQERRRKHTPTKIRGGRVWVQRTSPARYAVPNQGATWTMSYAPLLDRDFAAVKDYVKVSKA